MGAWLPGASVRMAVMGSPASVFGGDLRGGEFAELGFLFFGGCGVDALVDGVAVFGGEFGVELAGVFAGDGGHFGGEQAGDEAVFVGGPDLSRCGGGRWRRRTLRRRSRGSHR